MPMVVADAAQKVKEDPKAAFSALAPDKELIDKYLKPVLEGLSPDKLYHCSSANLVSITGGYRDEKFAKCFTTVFDIDQKCANGVAHMIINIIGESVLDSAGSCLTACEEFMIADKLEKCLTCMPKKVQKGFDELVGPGAGLMAKMDVMDMLAGLPGLAETEKKREEESVDQVIRAVEQQEASLAKVASLLLPH